MARSPELNDKASRKAKPPLTASPAFRWVVAIWFAALLGVGSLIVPVVLIERASTASGLASIFPQAAPPLGFTARALIAGIGTLGGAMLGLFFARIVSRERQPKPAQVTARRPLSASDELGDMGTLADELDEPVANKGSRRRALAIEEEEGPSDFLNVAPLPGVPVDGQPEEIATEGTPEPEERQTFQPLDGAEEVQPLELGASDELTDVQEAEEHDDNAYIAPEPHFDRQEFIAVAEASASVVEEEEPEPAPAAKAGPAMEPLAFSPPSMARPTVSWDEDKPAAKEPEMQAEAMPGFSLNDTAEPESEEHVSDKQIFDAPESAEATPAEPVEVQAEEQAAEQSDEGLVQLVQRLGATLEKHREWSAEQAAAAPTPVAPVAMPEPVSFDAPEEVTEEETAEGPALGDFDPAAADEAAEAMAAWFGSSKAAPAASEEPAQEEAPAPRQQYAPFANTLAATPDHDDDEDEDDVAELAASFSLPLAAKAQAEERPAFDVPPAVEAEPEPVAEAVSTDEVEEEEDHSADSDVFGSLNPFKDNPFKTGAEEFVRIEEPEAEEGGAEPAVLFPGQESRASTARAFDPPAGKAESAPARASRPAPSNDDNERALREALMNLQRMSK